ncbi:MAG: acetate--CoA ligase [Chloroflexi bacterium]|nr:acetate--CoA ligase [Chloroflexota bacterium]
MADSPATKQGNTGGGDGIAWRPSATDLERSRLLHFMKRHGIKDLPELLRRSTDDLDWFWRAVSDDLDLEWYRPFEQVVDTSRGIAWSTWWVGGQFNYVHNALDKHVLTGRRNKLALIWEGEDSEKRTFTYWELWVETNRLANALRQLGVGKGDRVGIYMPMVPEVCIASLACSKVGAIFTPIFSGYAAQAIAARLNDSGAKLLITADGFYRRGRMLSMKATADEAVAQSPSVEHVVVFQRLGQQAGRETPWQAGRDHWWHELLSSQPRTYDTERTDPEDPYMLIYTSGTTGRPKGAVHVHGGFPIKSAQDMAHCFDVGDQDIIFWFTDMGWMMGPWLFEGALMLGATALCYEGSPDYPRPDRVWQLVERYGVTVLGIAPTAIRALMPLGSEWVTKHDLSSLRVLGGTGEPWNPEPWRWYFEQVGGGRCPIVNYSGGTEIGGGIVGCHTIHPLKVCSFAGPVPGMAADVIDEAGNSVRGSVGELAIRKPWPGMTRGFWQDPERYLETYWSRHPDIWVHGDWATVDEDGFWFIQGRSDDTLKVAGKRLGPAEVESAAVGHPAVAEAAAIGVPHDVKGETVVLFVILNAGHEPTDALREAIKDAVAAELGRPLRPDAVRFVSDIPRTRNAKIMRRVIRAKHLGATDLGDLSGLDNPAAIDEIGRAR